MTTTNETDEDTISIAGLDKAAVLAALHNGTMAIGLGMLHDLMRDMTLAEAQALIDARAQNGIELYFDYLAGRPIKLDISGDIVKRTDLYDRDAGHGACAAAIAKLRTAR